MSVVTVSKPVGAGQLREEIVALFGGAPKEIRIVGPEADGTTKVDVAGLGVDRLTEALEAHTHNPLWVEPNPPPEVVTPQFSVDAEGNPVWTNTAGTREVLTMAKFNPLRERLAAIEAKVPGWDAAVAQANPAIEAGALFRAETTAALAQVRAMLEAIAPELLENADNDEALTEATEALQDATAAIEAKVTALEAIAATLDDVIAAERAETDRRTGVVVGEARTAIEASLATGLAGKVNVADLPAGLAGKADKTSLDAMTATVAGKADTTVVTALTARVAAEEALSVRRPTSQKFTATIAGSLLGAGSTRDFTCTFRRPLPDTSYDVTVSCHGAATGWAVPLSATQCTVTIRATAALSLGATIPVTVTAVPY